MPRVLAKAVASTAAAAAQVRFHQVATVIAPTEIGDCHHAATLRALLTGNVPRFIAPA
jgi:hypothetical protein